MSSSAAEEGAKNNGIAQSSKIARPHVWAAVDTYRVIHKGGKGGNTLSKIGEKGDFFSRLVNRPQARRAVPMSVVLKTGAVEREESILEWCAQ